MKSTKGKCLKRPSKQNGFILIKRSNKRTIARALQHGKGIVLLAEPKYYSWPAHTLTGEVDLRLFQKPLIVGTGLSNRHTGEREPGLNRDYRLYQKPQPSDDPAWEMTRESFKYLRLDDAYRFQTGPQCISYCGVFNRGEIALYITELSSLKYAFRYALTKLTEKINRENVREKRRTFQFQQKHIEAMLRYILDDLKDGKVVGHNIRMGAMADDLHFPIGEPEFN